MPGREPIYMQVYGAIRRDIEVGRFRIGSRLPGSRSMAVTLGVSRTVVLMAYEQLEGEGYVETRGGSGTYVSAVAIAVPPSIGIDAAQASGLANVPLSRFAQRLSLPPQTPVDHGPCAPEVIDLSLPRVRSDARSLKHWRQTVAQLVRRRSAPDYPVLEGAPPLRAAVARYLRMERGIVVDPGEVVIVSGTQQARDLVARVLLDEGAVVGVEDPCYWGVRHSYAATGARIVPCAVDGQGLDVAAHALALRDARLVSVGASFQYPTGAVMPMARKEALLRFAYAGQTCVVEDDFDCEHRFGVRASPSLWSMDRHGRVIYISSFARAVYPALQLGYMLVPAWLREKILAAKWLADRGCMSMQQHVLAACIDSGQYLRDIRRINNQLVPRHRALRDALKAQLGDAAEVAGEGAAGTLFASLPGLPGECTAELLAEALARGVRLCSGEALHAMPPSHVTLVLNYATLSEATLKAAAARLAQAVGAVAARRERSAGTCAAA
jgi:GntR family transcriptional regulator / MocR family aminotransferase